MDKRSQHFVGTQFAHVQHLDRLRPQRRMGGMEQPLHRARIARGDLHRRTGRQALQQWIAPRRQFAQIRHCLEGDGGFAQPPQDGRFDVRRHDPGVGAVTIQNVRRHAHRAARLQSEGRRMKREVRTGQNARHLRRRRFGGSIRAMKTSAGLLMYRVHNGLLQVFLVHPGGPYWAKKDEGAWSIPKGEVAEGEDLLRTACREFEEETGLAAQEPFLPLPSIRQKGGKVVHAWAFQGDCDPSAVRSNDFTMEWPPRSGRQQTFPEADRAEFFFCDEARRKINPAQAAWVGELERLIPGGG